MNKKHVKEVENSKSYLIVVSKVGDRSRGQPEGSLFNGFYTELLLSLDCFTLPLICTLYCWVLNKEVSNTTFLKSLVWRDLGLNPDLPDYRRTLYPLGQSYLIKIGKRWKYGFMSQQFKYQKQKEIINGFLKLSWDFLLEMQTI